MFSQQKLRSCANLEIFIVATRSLKAHLGFEGPCHVPSPEAKTLKAYTKAHEVHCLWYLMSHA